MKKILLPAIALISFQLNAQMSSENDKKKVYAMSATELIFSFGDVTDGEMKIDPVVRFSGFFHVQEQVHFDFSPYVGMYWGLGVRNVGFINTLNDSVKLKQRSYSAGIPIAFKFGSMKNKTWLAVGGEAEMMFAYKQKAFYAGGKFKEHEWFSDKVNVFNPSVFAEIHFKTGGYVRFKYYINDFLKEGRQSVVINNTPFLFTPEKSKLFYVAIGTAIKHKDGRKLNKMRDKNT